MTSTAPPRVVRVRSHAVALPNENVDTDQIIPARFLKVTSKTGLGAKLFHDWRYTAEGATRPDFVLNKPSSAGARILVAGDNFGCGSSREHAPWALVDWGFRAVVSTSFADIFKSNALKNGLVPVVVDEATLHALFEAIATEPRTIVTVDLEAELLTLDVAGGEDGVSFSVDPFARHCLLTGVDELGYLMQFERAIAEHEGR